MKKMISKILKTLQTLFAAHSGIWLLGFMAVVLAGFLIFYFKDEYSIKINFDVPNKDAKTIDDVFAKNIIKTLCASSGVGDIVCFSGNEKCRVYIKILPLYSLFLNLQTKFEIKNKISSLNFEYPFEIDEHYNYKIDRFIVISTNYRTNKDLRNISSELEDIIGTKNLLKKFEIYGVLENCIYIFFKNATLLKYDLQISDIVEKIKNNNTKNFSHKTSDKNIPILINGEIKNIQDIKNLVLFYKNNSFSQTFDDIFEIKEQPKNPPDYVVFLNGENAVVAAFSYKHRIFNFLSDYKIKKIIKNLEDKNRDFNFKFLNTAFLKKIEVVFACDTLIDFSYLKYREIEKIFREQKIPALYFIGASSPKIARDCDFFETDKSKITILVNFWDYIRAKRILKASGYEFLKNQKLENKKLKTIKYEINNFDLNDMFLEKEEVVNSIMAATDGLIAGYYYDNSFKTPIVLQCKNDNNCVCDTCDIFIYSKKTKTLAPLESVAGSELVRTGEVIIRKR